MRRLTLFMLLPLLAACASQQQQNSFDITTGKGIDEQTTIKLSEAAVAATDSLRTLAEVDQAAHPQAKIAPPPDANTYGMGQLSSIDWHGPIEQIVRRIANSAHYKLLVLGKAPAIPVLVSISATNTALGDILRDAGFQAGSKAKVIVFPSTKTIELRYANA